MFNNVFIEKDLLNSEYTKNILNNIKFQNKKVISNYHEVWGKVKKPYLQKRETLNLFIATKKGELIKEAPDAYGLGSEKHFYYIHAYNCIYECQYCYLQGYFNTPDLVLFVNHDEIISEMQNLIEKDENNDCWFHAGEFSDSLALSHITNELPKYFEFFYKNPNIKLELRTKSVNIRPLLQLEPANNIYISFTLSSEKSGKAFDFNCPSVTHRLNAIEKLVKHGYMIGIHLDPIIYVDNFLEDYIQFLNKLKNILPDANLGYISIGVVRFTKDVYREVLKNYPNDTLTKQDFNKSFDGKIRYSRPMRNWILSNVKNECIRVGYDEQKIYLCMED